MHSGRCAAAVLAAVAAVAALAVPAVSAGAAGGTSDEIHYTFTGATSVAFDWRGTATSLDYGLTTSYGATVTAVHPTAAPFSSAGPFWEAAITGLAANTTYHYSIGGGPDATFHTAPTGDYSVVAVGDLLDSGTAAWETQLHQLIAAQNPSFVMMLGDLTYANENCQPAVDIHFNDAMVWSRTAAYMPVWGNHEYGKVTAESKPCAVADDFRNYKGRFALPNPKTLSVDTATKANGPGCPLVNGTNPCRGEDWGWFDAGAVRWITGPEVWPGMVSEWRAAVAPIMAAAQADPNITTIVTASHRPGYSSRSEQISPDYTTALNSLGDAYPKFKLHLNGHTHALEVFTAQHGVIHVTAGGGGAVAVQQPPLAPGSVFFSRHPGFTRIDVAGGGVTLQTVCGPDNGKGIDLCTPGETTYGPVTITPPADGPPVAVASGSCAELSCTFDGSGSRDPGGTITDYSWAFGDGTSGTGAVVSHTYATPGTYTATLTVTGSDGGTASATTTITAQPMTFVGLRSTNATVKTATVTVPSGVTAGDGLLLVETVASTTVSIGAPTGAGTWTLLGTQEAGSMVTRVYARTAAAGDAGRTVSVALGDYAKIALQLAAYRGTRAGSPVASVVMAPDTTNSASHTTPTVTVSAPTWVVTVWADKSTSTTQWTVPSAVVTRDVLVGSGSGYLSAVLADSGATVPAGTYGGLVASTNQPTTKAVTATIVLAPA